MESKNLGVKINADSQYYKDFLEIVEKDKLTMPELYEYDIKSETPVIGRVMNDYNGFKKTLTLERFAGFEQDRSYNKKRKTSLCSVWIKTASVDDNFKLLIGKERKKLFISKVPQRETTTSYYLFDIPCKNDSYRLKYKNNFVDKMGRKLNGEGNIIDINGNVLEDDKGEFIGNHQDIVWLIDIPEKWTKIPKNFLQETYRLAGVMN